jgi:hypothetical protein
MKHDPIGQLLSQADAQARINVVDPKDLSQWVMRRAARRRAGRALASAAAIVVVGVVVLARLPGKRLPQVVVHESNADLIALQHQVEFQERLVDRMIEGEQLARDQKRLVSISIPYEGPPGERAAARLISQANRLLESDSPPQAAERAYTQVIDSFPETISAQQARKRLAELRKDG